LLKYGKIKGLRFAVIGRIRPVVRKLQTGIAQIRDEISFYARQLIGMDARMIASFGRLLSSVGVSRSEFD